MYNLKFEDLVNLERWGEKSAKNLLQSIEKSKSVPYPRVLFALGIRYVGETVAQKLAQAFPSIDALEQASMEDLMTVDGIGERIAQSVKDYFANPVFCDFVQRLRSHGLQFSLNQENLKLQSDKLKGKTFVISGTFKLHSRDEYKSSLYKMAASREFGIEKYRLYPCRRKYGTGEAGKANRLE